jgi:hypothetical protein
MKLADGFECLVLHTARKSGLDEFEAVRDARREARKRGKKFFVVANIENQFFLSKSADLAELFDAIDAIQDDLIARGYSNTLAKCYVGAGVMQKKILAALEARGAIDFARKLH